MYACVRKQAVGADARSTSAGMVVAQAFMKGRGTLRNQTQETPSSVTQTSPENTNCNGKRLRVVDSAVSAPRSWRSRVRCSHVVCSQRAVRGRGAGGRCELRYLSALSPYALPCEYIS
eukprot:3261043-Rhodomonas_salina.3